MLTATLGSTTPAAPVAETDLAEAYIAARMVQYAKLRPLLNHSRGRRLLTRLDPLLFALTYLSPHLRAKDGSITFSEIHLDLIKMAETWVVPSIEPMANRDAFVAPRKVGKSTWLFLALPLWAAAHQHLNFIAAFSDTAEQSLIHQTTFRTELAENELLRADFPELCQPARTAEGQTVYDSKGMYQAKNGFVFAARGITGGTLGLKIGHRRPDLLIIDDIEPGTGYSAYQCEERLHALLNVVFPLDDTARVLMAGTVLMSGSIIHQLTQVARGMSSKELDWVSQQKIRVHYWPAILKNDDGSDRSVWPGRWPIAFLHSIRGTREFAMTFMNLPVPKDSDYWEPRHFVVGDLPEANRVVLSIDPAVTTKKTSDQTAIAVVCHDKVRDGFLIAYCQGVRLRGEALRSRVLSVLDLMVSLGRPVAKIMVEVNQGGELWLDVLHDMPVPVVQWRPPNGVSKQDRAERLLAHYERGRVRHLRPLPELEQQMMEFPKGLHDDLVDSCSSAAIYLQPRPRVSLGGLAAS